MHKALKLMLAGLLIAGVNTVYADGHVKKLYEQRCLACHGTGAAGAPKFGDKAAWADRAKAGLDALAASAIKGKGAMPAKGGCNDCSDADIKGVVKYMLNAAK